MDREKVIKGLEECAWNGKCTKCQYVEEEPALSCKKLLVDALELIKSSLLKEQEPRVMTADEVQEDELVWIEVPQSDEIWPALLRETDWFDHPTWAMRGYALGGYYLHSGYGRDWRCWTAKPTEDQRLAVKWE